MLSRSIAVLTSVALILVVASTADVAADDAVVHISGTRLGLAAMERVADGLKSVAPSVSVNVLPSRGTSGGIRALQQREIDLVVASRPLTAQERAGGVTEAICYKTPLAFVSSRPAPPSISKIDLPGILTSSSPTWPDGIPLRPLLRPRANWEMDILVAAVPALGPALEAAYKSGSIPVPDTDQENAFAALRTAGSLTAMTLLQLRAEQRRLRTVALDGVQPTLANVAHGTYPLALKLCLVTREPPSGELVKFLAYLTSASGEALMNRLGAAKAD